MSTTPTHDERLEQLLNTSARVFAEHGYHGTSMRDLSRATGMSLAGMYHYVRGKDDLLYQIRERCFSEFIEGVRNAAQEGSDPADSIRRLVRHHVTFFSENMSQMKVLAHEADSLSEDAQTAITQLEREYLDLLTDLVRAARSSGPGPEHTIAAFGLVGMVNWLYTWYDPNGPIPPHQLADQFAALFLHGILAPQSSAVTPSD
jgi:AcrR family transcriptional regulator